VAQNFEDGFVSKRLCCHECIFIQVNNYSIIVGFRQLSRTKKLRLLWSVAGQQKTHLPFSYGGGSRWPA